MLRPMKHGLKVVADVVAIVPALMVELHVDDRDAVAELVAGLVRADEGVLYPVAGHGHQAEGHEWQDEGDKRGLPVHEAHGYTEEDEEQFAPDGLPRQLVPSHPEEVPDQGVDAGEEESEVVLHEVRS